MESISERFKTSAYPRRGYPLSPVALGPILDVPIPDTIRAHLPVDDRDMTLADLDDSVWVRFDEPICRELAGAVVAEVLRRYRSLPEQVVDQRLERFEDSPDIGPVSLSRRTLNALTRSGLLDLWGNGEKVTVGSLVDSRPGLGPKSLVDALVTHEYAMTRSLDRPAPTEVDVDTEVRRIALQILRSPEMDRISTADPRLDSPWFIRAYTRRDRLCDMTFEDLARRILKAEHHLKDYPLAIFDSLRVNTERARSLAFLTLEEELGQLARLDTSERDARVFVSHRGWDGSGGRTLREVAEESGMSHERVRQISNEIAQRLARRSMHRPVLERAIHLVAMSAPCRARDAHRILRESGTAQADFDLRGLLDAAAVLGLEVPWRLTDGRRSVSISEEGLRRHRVLTAARWTMAARGFMTVADLTAQLATDGPITDGEVRETLAAHEHTRWLDDGRETFWVTDAPRNAMVDLITKMLAAHGPQEACELREGLKRSSRLRAGAPSTSIIIAMCRRIPGLTLDGTGHLVSVTDRAAVGRSLSPNERVLTTILERNGGVLSRHDYRELCAATGMARASFSLYLDTQSFIEELERGIYTLRGVHPEQRLIEELIARSLGV